MDVCARANRRCQRFFDFQSADIPVNQAKKGATGPCPVKWRGGTNVSTPSLGLRLGGAGLAGLFEDLLLELPGQILQVGIPLLL
jgi:hypothetical protein